MAERVELAQVIGQLRHELSVAIRDGEGEDLRFELGPVELELTVAVSDGSAPAHRGVVSGQVAEIIVSLDGEVGRRGSGYRVGPSAVLTAAHVVDGATSVRVRFDADRPGEWVAVALSCWTDARSDLAVLTIAPREGEPPAAARFGRIGDRAAVLAARALGFPLWKLRTDDGDRSVYRDSHQADGSVAVLSNRREGTLEVTVPPPERDPDPAASPWEGMSGAVCVVAGGAVGGQVGADGVVRAAPSLRGGRGVVLRHRPVRRSVRQRCLPRRAHRTARRPARRVPSRPADGRRAAGHRVPAAEGRGGPVRGKSGDGCCW